MTGIRILAHDATARVSSAGGDPVERRLSPLGDEFEARCGVQVREPDEGLLIRDRLAWEVERIGGADVLQRRADGGIRGGPVELLLDDVEIGVMPVEEVLHGGVGPGEGVRERGPGFGVDGDDGVRLDQAGELIDEGVLVGGEGGVVREEESGASM